MAGLDFRRAADLFVSSDRELAAALRISAADVARFRARPESAPAELLSRLGTLLIERGQGMTRVGQMLQDANAD